MTAQFAPNTDHLDTGRSDDDLVDALLRGTDARFDIAATVIYRRHSPAVLRFASMIASSREIALDATQEAFVWLTASGEQGGARKFDASRGSLAALLCGVARNHVLRLQTADARFVLADDDSALDGMLEAQDLEAMPTGFEALEQTQRSRALLDAVAQLPYEFREAIVLVELEGMSYEAAAAVIGCPIGTIRSRLSRAKARLKDGLTELFTPHTGNSA
ncbi:MAG: sigma-70 family RNA polymerase sigma factor [Betaproteobacteria bacterium]|nr:MAG: sigma-70 family RNA polymerase sigma factor [Betaproteobacteria bacterium]